MRRKDRFQLELGCAPPERGVERWVGGLVLKKLRLCGPYPGEAHHIARRGAAWHALRQAVDQELAANPCLPAWQPPIGLGVQKGQTERMLSQPQIHRTCQFEQHSHPGSTRIGPQGGLVGCKTGVVRRCQQQHRRPWGRAAHGDQVAPLHLVANCEGLNHHIPAQSAQLLDQPIPHGQAGLRACHARAKRELLADILQGSLARKGFVSPP